MSEHRIQNDFRNAAADHCLLFRANVGKAWQGEPQWLPDGRLLLTNPRRFSTGLPVGFADLFGLVPVVVTPEMVGKTVAVFLAVEMKDDTKKAKANQDQKSFIHAVRMRGGRAGVAKTIDEGMAIVQGVNP